MMKTLRRLVPGLAALALLASARPAAAQRLQLLGSRVRVTAPAVMPDKFTGVVTQYDTAQLAVRDTATGAEQSFPLHSILFLEISKGSGRGGSVGGRAGLLAFVLGGLGAIGGAMLHPFNDNVGTSAALGAGAGVVVGGGIGAAWGAGTPRERWTWAVRPFGYDPRPGTSRAAVPDSATVPAPRP